MPRRSSERTRPASSSRGARLDERARRLDVRRLDERVGGGGAELRLDLVLDLLAEALLDVGAQLGERVELARGARQLVVERRQHLLLELLERDRRPSPSTRRRARTRRPSSRPATCPTSASSSSSTQAARAELDDEVALRLAPSALTRSTTTTSPVAGRRGPRPATSSATAKPERLELLRRPAPRAPRRRRRGTSSARPVGHLDLRLHVDGGGEAERPLGRLGQLVVVLGLGDRADARPGERRSGTSRSMWLSTASV